MSSSTLRKSIGHFAGGVVQRRQRYESGPRVLDAAANDTGAQSDEPGGYGGPYPREKPNYVGPHHGDCDLDPGADTHGNADLYERDNTTDNVPSH